MLQSCVHEVRCGVNLRDIEGEGGKDVIPTKREHDDDATRQHRQVELGGNGLLP